MIIAKFPAKNVRRFDELLSSEICKMVCILLFTSNLFSRSRLALQNVSSLTAIGVDKAETKLDNTFRSPVVLHSRSARLHAAPLEGRKIEPEEK